MCFLTSPGVAQSFGVLAIGVYIHKLSKDEKGLELATQSRVLFFPVLDPVSNLCAKRKQDPTL